MFNKSFKYDNPKLINKVEKWISEENVFDPNLDYPSDYFRLQLYFDRILTSKEKKVIEVGSGNGFSLPPLVAESSDVWGIDNDQKYVEKSQTVMKEYSGNKEQILFADIEKSESLHCIPHDFDLIISNGVLPVIKNQKVAIENMHSILKTGGKAFIEFRNAFFSLFTFNKYTQHFIDSTLLADVKGFKATLNKELSDRLKMEIPPFDVEMGPKYDNPHEAMDMVADAGFKDLKLHWFHYHPAMPYLEKQDPVEFRRSSIDLEKRNDWRGMFLASTFIIEGTR